MTDLVLYEREGPVARITLNRPDVRNAQSVALLRELDAAFTRARDDDEARVVVLTGAGDHFSAGHDLGTPQETDEIRFRATAGILAVSGRSWELYSELTMRWRDMPKPTIAQIDGYCIYAGWTVASAMDIVIASDRARFLPHLSEFFTLPWIVGTRRAKEILFTNRMLDAPDALRLGLVNEVVPATELARRTDEVARRIAASDPGVLRLIKGAVNAVEDTMGFAGAIRTAQSYNLLAYHEQANVSASPSEGRSEIALVRDALDNRS